MMNFITSRFHFEENILINFENKQFPLIKYDSELHSDLAYQLQDPDLARTIHTAYTSSVADRLNGSDKELFEKALLRVCLLFGSQKYPPHHALRMALLEENFPIDSWLAAHEAAFNEFMHQANQSRFTPRSPKHCLEKAHVVITTTSAAGGNLAVAEGLKAMLERRQFRVSILDVEKMSEEVDPIMIATGTHTCDRIYAQVVQQENNFKDGFELMMNVGRNIARYIEPTLGQLLKNRVCELEADFFLDTLNGHRIGINVSSSLGIPSSIIHCDCQVGYYYNDYFGKIQSKLFKMWFPADVPRVFKPILDRKNIAWEQFEKMPWNDFRNVLAEAIQVSVETIDEQVEFVGAPTRPEIQRINDPIAIAALRKEWKLDPGEAGIIVTMGKNGVGKMTNVFEELLKSEAHKLPIKYIFVCGTNQAMKSNFEDVLASTDLSNSALQRCEVVGCISGEKMNELLNIGTLVQGKPGGSQTEECIEVGIPMMILFSHGIWESGNQARLEREGYALSYDEQGSLAEQTERHVETLKDKLPIVKRRKWKKLVPASIRKALSESAN